MWLYWAAKQSSCHLIVHYLGAYNLTLVYEITMTSTGKLFFHHTRNDLLRDRMNLSSPLFIQSRSQVYCSLYWNHAGILFMFHEGWDHRLAAHSCLMLFLIVYENNLHFQFSITYRLSFRLRATVVWGINAFSAHPWILLTWYSLLCKTISWDRLCWARGDGSWIFNSIQHEWPTRQQ